MDLRMVKVERLVCSPCGTEGWAGDNWLSTGVFHFDDETFVQLGVLNEIREAMSSGVPMKAWITSFLRTRQSDPMWLYTVGEDLAER